MCGRACSIQTTTWAAPWQRAVKPSSSPASPQRSWEVSVLTERERESEGVGGEGWWGRGVKREVLAINVSQLEQCSYSAPALPGKSFSIKPFCQCLTGCIGFQLWYLGNKISHWTVSDRYRIYMTQPELGNQCIDISIMIQVFILSCKEIDATSKQIDCIEVLHFDYLR